jgi:serine/threonine-protein kinase HipA
MENNTSTLELFLNGVWHRAASLLLTGDSGQGCQATSILLYDSAYAIDYLNRQDAAALSATFPVALAPIRTQAWPPFLVDLLPQGFGRRELAGRLGIPAGSAASDWPLLLHGAANPIGNIRIREAWVDTSTQSTRRHGFTEAEIAERSGDFMEYLASEGFYVAGSSGIQGEWPKILMTQADDGLWHLDHLLDDAHAKRHCLVKFARTPDPVYEGILRLERIYHRVALDLGLRVLPAVPEFIGNALFIERFDRRTENGRLERIGQESLYSLCGKPGFDSRLTHDEAVMAIAKYCTHPLRDVIEYILRDVANVALGNRDNHGRNTAFQRFADGEVRIAPLYDFAPMFLHPEGIARRIRWEHNDGGAPVWSKVAAQAAGCLEGNPEADIRNALAEFAPRLARIPELLLEYGADPVVVRRLEAGIAANVKRLEACGTGSG